MFHRPLLRFALSLVILAPMAGCNKMSITSTIVVTKPFSAASPGPVTTSLNLDVPLGDVTIQLAQEPSAGLAFSGTLGAEDQATLDAVKVDIARTEGDVVVKASGPSGRSWKTDLVVKLPPGTRLVLKSGVGNVSLRGLDGAIQAEVGVGTLKATNLSLAASCRLETGTGNVAVEIGSWQKDQALDVKVGVGDASVQVPADAGLGLTATTGVGKIRESGLTWSEKSGGGSMTSEKLQGFTTTSPDGRQLKVVVGVGNVTVKTASPTPKS